MSQLYLGLMSGTSMDGVDAALVDFSGLHPRLIDCQTYPYPPQLLSELHQLCSPSKNEIVLMGRADRAVAEIFAEAVLNLLKANYIRPDQITAIGSHGQTIRHMPHGKHAFSLQIGDPNTLSCLTGINVVADFRRKDIALDGQGAPLVPAFHQAVFAADDQTRVVLNIGGISNITYLPADKNKAVLGFDTGPGNTLMDAWCLKHTGQKFDLKGAWAAKSSADADLFAVLYGHPYFKQSAPKSTGREVFNLEWLEKKLAEHPLRLRAESVQSTLVLLTCRTIAEQITKLSDVTQVFVCGGGSQNEFLMECLENELHECELSTTDALGIPADAVEAMAFAWLAYAHINAIEGNIPTVTGARKAAVLGTFCPGFK
ncbi:MAG: anhydro-N-acetylmuramic acid kinase [Paraglaciecola sp.]|jgi:anhydro-N-acetylmuramic acid kinase